MTEKDRKKNRNRHTSMFSLLLCTSHCNRKEGVSGIPNDRPFEAGGHIVLSKSKILERKRI